MPEHSVRAVSCCPLGSDQEYLEFPRKALLDRIGMRNTLISTDRFGDSVIVPSHNLVIVRRGLDYGRQGFSQWDLTREVLKAMKVPRSRGPPVLTPA